MAVAAARWPALHLPQPAFQALLDRDGGHDPAGDRSAKDQPGVASSTSASRRYDTDEQMPLAP